MSSITTTNQYGSMTDAWAHRALLQRTKPKHVHNLFGKAFTLPQKNSDTISFRRQENLNSDPVVLSQDSDPAPEQINKFDIAVTVQEFGKVVLLGRKVLLVVEDDTASETADNLNQTMHTMLDKVTRDVWDSGVSQITSLNGANGNAVTEITQADLDRAIAFLDENDSEKTTPVIQGTSRFGTGPVEDAYWLASHVKLKPDIRALDAFMPTAAYGSQDPVLQAEFGAVDEVRVVTSSLVQVTTADPAVFSNTMIAANAYGYVAIDEVATEMILKPLGANDLLNRFQSMGFTAYFAAQILDDSHIVTLLSTKK